MTLQEQIQSYIGIYSNTELLDLFLTEGVTTLVHYIPEEKLTEYITITTMANPSANLTTKGKRIIHVYGSDLRDAMKVPSSRFTQAQDKNSIFYETGMNPVWTNINGNIKVAPSGIVYSYSYPTDVDCLSQTINNFPVEFIRGVILDVVIKITIMKLQNPLVLPDLSAITIPATPSVPVINYVNATIGNYIDLSWNLPGSAPTYTPPSMTIDFTGVTGLASATEDTELASNQIALLRSQTEKYSQDLQNSINQFNQANVLWQGNINQLIENVRLSQQKMIAYADKQTDLNLQNAVQTVNSQLEFYKTNLESFAQEVNIYQAKITSTAQTFMATVQGYAITQKNNYDFLMSLKNEFNEFLQTYCGIQVTPQPTNGQ